MKKKFYAVRKGITTGIFQSLEECKKQTLGVKGSEYRGFPKLEQAELYLKTGADLKEQTDDRYYIYVDGSYSIKSNCFGWGIAVYHHGYLIETLNGFGRNELKNLAGELQAAREAVNWAIKNNKKVVICYDFNGIRDWVYDVKQIKHRFVGRYIRFMKKHLDRINFRKVPAHCGIGGNMLADRLAKQAIKFHASTTPYIPPGTISSEQYVKKLRERYYVSTINNYENTSNYVKRLRQFL